MGYVDEDDGKFWIEWSDFIECYRNVYVCKLIDERFPRDSTKGEWDPSNNTAGGCKSSDLKNNPQFLLKVTPSSMSSSTGNCDITIRLSICEDANNMLRGDFPAIGIYVTNKNVNAKLVGTLYQSDVNSKTVFQYQRDVLLDFKMSTKSPVVIIPCTFEQGKKASFTIMAFNTSSEDPISIQAL